MSQRRWSDAVHQGSAPRDDDGALVALARQGDLPGCQQIVQRYALETLRTAYLLTDNRATARQVARSAFNLLFRNLPAPDGDVDLRAALLLHVADVHLSPSGPDTEPPVPGHNLLQGHSGRFQVDDQRTRTRAGLALLAPAERVALVLREFNGLSIEQIATVVDERPDLLTAELETSRRRMRNHLDLRPEETLRAVMVGAAFDGPSGNLWIDLEPDVVAIQQQLGTRRRMLSAGVVTLMMAVMVVTLAVLLRDPGPAETDASELRFETNAVNDPAPFPTIAPPRATGTNPARARRGPTPRPPVQDVPDTLLMALMEANASDGLSHLTTFRPRHSVKLQPLVDWSRLNRERWAPVMSHDGQTLFLAHVEPQESAARVLVSAVDSRDQSVRWQVELDRVAAVPAGDKPDVFTSIAVDERYVFVVLHYWRESELIQLVVLDQATGELVNAWPVNIAGRIANDVRVLRPPESDFVYVYAITQAQPVLVGQMHISFYGYEVETGREVHGKTLVEAEDRRVFYMYKGQVTADGKSLYGVTYRSTGSGLAVQFFDLVTATVQPPVRVPFNSVGERAAVLEAVSHDGRWFYIFSPRSSEMAIIDLQHRQLVGIIPLEVTLPDSDGLGAVNLPDNTMQISPDGSRIYAIGALAGTSSSSGVWVIDTSTWQVSAHWAIETSPARILLGGDGDTLYLHERSGSIGAPAHGQITGIDTGTGEIVFRENLAFLPDTTAIRLESMAGLYRKQFGQSPSIDSDRPRDNRDFTSLPVVEAAVNPGEAQPGDQVVIQVRFVHPFTGEPVTSDDTATRYQPPGGVRAILRDESGAARDIIIELGSRGYAEYHGTVSIEEAGQWTLSLVNDWSTGSGSSHLVATSATLQVTAPTPGIGTGSLRIHSAR